MAITTMDGLLSGLEATRRITFYKASTTSEGAGTFHSLFKIAGNPSAGVNPPTGVGEIPTSSTLGTFDFTNPAGTNTKYIARINMQGSTLGTLVIYDRLWHNSGQVGNVITPQTVNSTALTRYTDGVGVEIWGEVYTAMGATGSVFSVTYTDSGDVSRIATYTQPANALSVGQMFSFIPPIGGTGCKSIQSVQLSVSTGTAGNFGLVLMRRMAEIPLTAVNIGTVMDAFALGMPIVQPSAALCPMVSCTATNTGTIIGAVDIIEG